MACALRRWCYLKIRWGGHLWVDKNAKTVQKTTHIGWDNYQQKIHVICTTYSVYVRYIHYTCHCSNRREAEAVKCTSTHVFMDGRISTPHMPILRPHCHVFGSQTVIVVNAVVVARAGRFVRLWASGRAQFTKNWRFPALDADVPPCKIWRRRNP